MSRLAWNFLWSSGGPWSCDLLPQRSEGLSAGIADLLPDVWLTFRLALVDGTHWCAPWRRTPFLHPRDWAPFLQHPQQGLDKNRQRQELQGSVRDGEAPQGQGLQWGHFGTWMHVRHSHWEFMLSPQETDRCWDLHFCHVFLWHFGLFDDPREREQFSFGSHWWGTRT